MKLSDFDFDLPDERIALRPAEPRDSARLLVVSDDGLQDRQVRDLPGFLRPGDILVFNDTRVIPARLNGLRVREETTVRVEATLHRRLSPPPSGWSFPPCPAGIRKITWPPCMLGRPGAWF